MYRTAGALSYLGLHRGLSHSHRAWVISSTHLGSLISQDGEDDGGVQHVQEQLASKGQRDVGHEPEDAQ